MRDCATPCVLRATAASLAVALSACATSPHGDRPAPAAASAETARVAGSGDAADDPAIWVAPDPARSLILGTDKTRGLYVYDLQGAEKQFLAVGRLNNVDLRDGFRWGARDVTLVAATDRTSKSLAVFVLDPDTGRVAPAQGGLIPLDVADPYGACLTRRPDGTFMAAVTGTGGELRQLALSTAASGDIDARLVRSLEVGSITEGCVFDDRTGALYLAEENVGIWRLAADPAAGDGKTLVHAADGKALVPDIEGLAIHPEGADGGWLIASSQGDSAYALFQLPEGRYAGRIYIAGGAVDAVTGTDGIDATSKPLPGYPEGLLVVQDDEDDAGGQNFKLVDWRDVIGALEAARNE